MKLLQKPYTHNQYVAFVEECNSDGKIRIEIHDGNAYGMYDYEVFENGEVIDLRNTLEYQAEQSAMEKQMQTEQLQSQLAEIDQKRIRAVCEPDGVRDDGTTWLEYYNSQAAAIRAQLNNL